LCVCALLMTNVYFKKEIRLLFSEGWSFGS
jgi:hypothetical protein